MTDDPRPTPGGEASPTDPGPAAAPPPLAPLVAPLMAARPPQPASSTPPPPGATPPLAPPPAAPPTTTQPPAGPAVARSKPLWLYIVGLVGVLVFAVVVINAIAPDAPAPSCETDIELCPDPPPGDPDQPVPTLGAVTTPGPLTTPGPAATAGPFVPAEPYIDGTVWTSSEFGFQVVYDPKAWKVLQEDPTFVVLESVKSQGLWAVFEGALASDMTVDAMVKFQVDFYEQYFTSVEEDDDPYRAILGPHIGYVSGEGGSYSTTGEGPDGLPRDPVGIAIMAATDGDIVVGFVLEVADPASLFDDETTREHAYRGRAEALLKDFRWPR